MAKTSTESKKTVKSKKKAVDTADIRSFFGSKTQGRLSSNSIAAKPGSNGDNEMASKRKKNYESSESDEEAIRVIKKSKKVSKRKDDSDSDEEAIRVVKKSKKVSKRKDDSDSDEEAIRVIKKSKKVSKRKDDSDSDEEAIRVVKKSKKVSKRKDDSDSDEEAIRVIKKSKKVSKRKDDSDSDEEAIRVVKKSKKVSKRKDDSDSDEYVPQRSKKASKRMLDSDSEHELKKPAQKATAKKSTDKSKTSSKSAAKPKTSSKSKKPTTKGSKNKLVKPINYESENEHSECEMVSEENMPTKAGFESFLNTKRVAGDKKNDNIGMLWVDRHRPRKMADIVGQNTPKSCANKLKNWLINFEENKNVKPIFNAKDDTGAGKRAALLSGIAGIGKTTTAQLVAKECGWDYVEFNASDTRNKKGMDTHIQTLIANKSLSGYIQDPNHETEMTIKHLVIMDEVDGMAGNADRGGIGELMQLIKKSHIPIICICNDRNSIKIRSLANLCFDLKFPKLRVEQIRKRVNEICTIEGVKVSPSSLEELIEKSNRDMRQIIHYLSVFGTKTKTLSNMKGSELIKNVTPGLFEALHSIFSAGPEYDSMSFNQKQSLFFADYEFLPLMVHENYLTCRPDKSKTAAETLALACKSIDAICIGDMISNEIRSNQAWNLLPQQACFSTVLPGYYMNGHIEAKIEFTTWLGKNSTTRARQKAASAIKQHMNLSITGSNDCMVLDLLLPLRNLIIKPLLKGEKDAIPNAIKTLINYNLLKSDLDSLIDLTLWSGEKSPYAAVDTKTKSAFTRSFNGSSWTMPYAFEDMYKKVGKGAKEPKSKKKQDDEEEEEQKESKDETILPDF